MNQELTMQQFIELAQEFQQDPYPTEERVLGFAEAFKTDFKTVNDWFVMSRRSIEVYDDFQRHAAMLGKRLFRTEHGYCEEFILPTGFYSRVVFNDKNLKLACERRFCEQHLINLEPFILEMQIVYCADGFAIRQWFIDAALALELIKQQAFFEKQPIVTFPDSPLEDTLAVQRYYQQVSDGKIQEVSEYDVNLEVNTDGVVSFPESDNEDVIWPPDEDNVELDTENATRRTSRTKRQRRLQNELHQEQFESSERQRSKRRRFPSSANDAAIEMIVLSSDEDEEPCSKRVCERI